MDKLVGEQSRIGILTIADLGAYHRKFLAICYGRLCFLLQNRSLSPHTPLTNTFIILTIIIPFFLLP